MAKEQNTNARKRKKTGFRRKLSYGVAVLATLVLAFFLFTKSNVLAYQVSSYVNEHYLKNSPFEFSCGRITGDLVHHVVIRDPVLRYHSPTASFNVFRADEIVLDYKLLDVIKLNFVAEQLVLRNVRLQIRQDENGELVLPLEFDLAPQLSAPGMSPKVDVQRFHVAGLSLRFGGGERELGVRDVDLSGAFRYRDNVGRLEISEGRAFLTHSETRVSSVRLDVEHTGGAVTLRDFLVRLDRSLIMATGSYEAGEFDNLQIVFNPISLGELHQLGLAPEYDGEFGGSITMNGRLDDLKVRGTLSGTGVGVAVSGLAFDGRIDSKEIDLDRLTGQVFGCRVDGAFRLRIDGPGDLFYQGHVEGLDLTDGFLPDKGLPVTNITGDLTLDHDATAHTWDFRGTVGPSTVDGYEIRSGEVSGVYTDGSGLVVRRARLIRPGYEMDATGFVEEEGGVFDMVMSVEGHDLTYFWDYFDLPHVDVKVSGTARLTGPPEDMRINLNGDVRDVGFLFAGIDSGVVNAELLGIGSTNPSARIDITGRHARIRDAVFDNPHVYIEVEEDRVHIRDITVSRGDTTFSAGFDVDGNEDTTIVYVLRGSIRSPYETWGLAAPTTIRHEMGDVYIDSLVFVSPGGEVGFAGSYWKSRDTVAFEAWGTNADLEVLRRALALPFPLSGRAAFDISANGDAQNPRVELFVDAVNGVIDSTAFDVFRANASFDGRAYHLEELTLITRSDSISARGRWNYVDSPLRIMRAGLDPRARDAAFELDLSAQHYPLATVLRALHQPVWVGGVFGGTVAFRGSPGAPEITVEGSVQRRVGPGVSLPDTVQVDARYADGMLRVNDLHIAGALDVTAAGSLALNLSLFDGLEVSSDAAVRATLDVGESDLSGLRVYIPGLAVLGGLMEGEISVKGTLARPEFAGALAIRGGLVRFDELAESYRDVNARIDFVGSTMRLSSFSARSGDKGAIYASGAMELAGFKAREYHVDVSLTDFRLKSIPDFESVQNGTLRISSLEWSDGRVIPSFDGSFIVQEARLYWVFDATGATQAQITMPTDEPGWVCSIDLSADNNIWVRNQDLSVEMRGELILKRDEQGLYLRGDLTMLRGSYNVYANKFRVIDGALNFSTAETLRPEVYINAYTPYRNEGGIEKRIFLSLNWPQDKKEPTIQLSYEDPGYYESDLWRMLGGSNLAGGIAANTLERALNQQMSGLSIEVDQETTDTSQPGTPEQEMMIGVGKYLWEDFYLRYRQGLTFSTEQQIQMEYRISRLFLLRSEFIRNSRRGYIARNGQYTDEFNFDVKFRWEY